MITVLLIVAAIAVLLFIAIWLSVRSRAQAYSRIERDQTRIARRLEKREQRRKAQELKQRKAEARRRLRRRRLSRRQRKATVPQE